MIISIALLMIGQLQAQLVLQPGAQFTGTGNITILVEDMDLVNHDTATNFTSTSLYMTGGNTNEMQGYGNWKVYKLICYKNSGQLRLATAVQVMQELLMASGQLDLNGQTLTLLPGALVQNENEVTHVTGPNGGVLQTTVSLNAPQAQNPGNMGAIITSPQNLGSVTIKRWHGPADAGKANRYYEITPSLNTALNATLRFQYLDAELNNQSEPGLVLFTRNNTQAPWTNLGWDTRDAVLNDVSKTALNTLQQYSIGSVAMPLPVKWGAVQVHCTNPEANIQWTTLMEENVASFSVQKSSNALQWASLATLPAKGNSTVPQSYQYIDKLAGEMAFYRVLSTDIDGKTSYSPVRQLKNCQEAAQLVLGALTSTSVSLHIKVSNAGSAALQLFAADGRLVYEKKHSLVSGSQQVVLPLQQLAAGAYHIVLSTTEGVSTKSFMKK